MQHSITAYTPSFLSELFLYYTYVSSVAKHKSLFCNISLYMAKHKSLFCIFSFFVVHFFNIMTSTTANNETDLRALLALKNSITDELGALSSWNETTHFCTWKGVTCGKRHRDRVVSIILRSQGLFGSLTPHLGNISFLRAIILPNNIFYGPIPGEIGRLRRLEYVELSNNTFQGEIPRNITQCNNLYYLNLIGNNLTGIIFPEKLEALGLSSNRFSGTIPPSIGNLSSLSILALRNCGLKGEIPESFVNLRNLTFLLLSENSLSGHIPFGLFNISTISSFSVRSNELEGTIPRDIALTLPNLRELLLSDNHFSGEIPRSFSNATNLEKLDLSWNNFTGPMLNNLENLKSLKYFIVSGNNILGDFSFFSSLTNSSGLRVLAVERTLLEGSLPDSIANLSSQLYVLSLYGNQIHGNIPSGIGSLVGLAYLELYYNYLSGPIPSSIGKLVRLYELDLQANVLTSEIPNSIGNLTILNRLYLADNDISGSIPHSLSNCSSLSSIDLSHNNLNGSIPRGILSLSSISIMINLGHNELTGPIPSDVGMLKNLGALDLSNNNFSGSIPSTLSSCESLQNLSLEGNFLEGSIPIGLSSLRGLGSLDLSRNQLSGPVPNFLAEMNLSYLNLSFNRLQGQVPTQGVFRNASAISVAGNEDLCGGVPELKLRPCPTSNPAKKKFPKVLLIIIPILVTIVISLMVSVFIFFYKRRKAQVRKSKISMPSSEIDQFMRLSYGDLLKATGGFSDENLIGSGRFGSVYRGILSDEETMVAVKVLNLNVRGAINSFVAECNALREIRHRNLVKILSVCVSENFRGEDFKALIYEYKPQGSLDSWLHHQGGEHRDVKRMPVTMIQRLNIAIDIASALEYLHCGTDSTVIHGDVKPSNILLDEDMTAHVGDFGLAKVISSLCKDVLLTHHPSSSSTAVKGTIGYIAPEYGMEGTVSTQGDVYSFGILLLEMFTCKRPTDDEFNEHRNLHSFVSSALPSRVMDVVDPKIVQLQSDIDVLKIKDCLIRVLSVGLACSMEHPGERMSMKDAVVGLKKARTTCPVLAREQ